MGLLKMERTTKTQEDVERRLNHLHAYRGRVESKYRQLEKQLHALLHRLATLEEEHANNWKETEELSRILYGEHYSPKPNKRRKFEFIGLSGGGSKNE